MLKKILPGYSMMLNYLLISDTDLEGHILGLMLYLLALGILIECLSWFVPNLIALI